MSTTYRSKLSGESFIDRFLLARDLTAADVATQVGMSRQLFQMKKDGTIRFSRKEVELVARVLGCTVSDIAVDETDEKNGEGK